MLIFCEPLEPDPEVSTRIVKEVNYVYERVTSFKKKSNYHIIVTVMYRNGKSKWLINELFYGENNDKILHNYKDINFLIRV